MRANRGSTVSLNNTVNIQLYISLALVSYGYFEGSKSIHNACFDLFVANTGQSFNTKCVP